MDFLGLSVSMLFQTVQWETAQWKKHYWQSTDINGHLADVVHDWEIQISFYSM